MLGVVCLVLFVCRSGGEVLKPVVPAASLSL